MTSNKVVKKPTSAEKKAKAKYEEKRGKTVLRVVLTPHDDPKEWEHINNKLASKYGSSKRGVYELAKSDKMEWTSDNSLILHLNPNMVNKIQTAIDLSKRYSLELENNNNPARMKKLNHQITSQRLSISIGMELLIKNLEECLAAK